MGPMKPIRAFAAYGKGKSLEPFESMPGELGPEEVEIRVESCGICHSDLSMIDNDWGQSAYPLVPGHEVAGVITEAGAHVRKVKVGDRVGLGWFAGSCMSCDQCLSGDHNLCSSAEQTIVGRHGGFADRVRSHWAWAVPIPEAVSSADAGPLFCGGITVFNPFVQFGTRPTDRVAVVGVGGLGHLAVQFASKWGCEVYAFTSNTSKRAELERLGAHHVIDSRDPQSWQALTRRLDMVLVTVNVPLDWTALMETVAPKGRLHFVGAVLEPVPVAAFSLIAAQRQVSGNPLGSPASIATMLEFCARHQIAPVIERFPMSRVNEALERGKVITISVFGTRTANTACNFAASQ
jgi:alcohol/geraniol dehydrogenase (NADP+)